MTIQFPSRLVKLLGKQRFPARTILLGGCALTLLSGFACSQRAPESAGGIDSGNPKAAAERTAAADKLYQQREDMAQARQSVALLRQARIEDYASYEIAWKLSRSDYYVGDHTDNDRERVDSFREGIQAGQAAVKLHDGKPEGHFWLGANYGGSAKNSTIASYSSVEDIRKEMEAVLKLEEGFQAGSAYLGLGQLYLQAPRMLGGDRQKAITYLEKGLPFGKDNALLRLRLAEAYHQVNRDQEALKQIDYLLAMKIDPAFTAEYKEAVEKGQKLRGELRARSDLSKEGRQIGKGYVLGLASGSEQQSEHAV